MCRKGRQPRTLAFWPENRYNNSMNRISLLLAAALAAPLPATAESGRFSVFGNSPEREAFFSEQATERDERAAEIAKAEAGAEERRLEAEREAALAAASAPAPALVTGQRAFPVYDPNCVKPTNRDYQRPLPDGGNSGLTVRREALNPCPTATYRPVSPYPTGSVIVLGPDGVFGSVRRPGLSINLSIGN